MLLNQQEFKMLSKKAKRIRSIIKRMNRNHNFNFNRAEIQGVPYIYVDNEHHLVLYIASRKQNKTDVVKEVCAGLEKKGYRFITTTYDNFLSRDMRYNLIIQLLQAVISSYKELSFDDITK